MGETIKPSVATLTYPLAQLRVVEITDGKGEMCGRLLADMGAEVILVEPPQGLASRQQQPVYQGESLHFASHNANKRSVALDLDSAADRAVLLDLIGSADIVIDGTPVGALAARELPVATLRARNPGLVLLAISDFGQTGPYAGFTATNSVHMAMAAMLARSGIAGQRPLLPPGELAYETTAVQAAWAVLIAYWQHLHTGAGNYLDFSVFEATAQILDPGLGVTGSAAAGLSAGELAPYGRPPVGMMYPIFPCADGHVRICVLNPRQWQGMSAWLGSDHPFTDPQFGNIAVRFQKDNLVAINALIGQLFAGLTVADIVREGQGRGVPCAGVSTPQQVLNDAHFNARGAFTELPVAGARGKVPSGYFELDGQRMGIRQPAPAVGADTAVVLGSLTRTRAATGTEPTTRRPFSGLRVLDLGVIVAGAELGRLFADQGAQVIKVENTAFADGLRQSRGGSLISQSFAQGSRNKLSFGLNLRDPRGIAIFNELAAQSDMVFSNFKPGTLESLGIGYEQLKAINPGIIVVESSALGNTGPLAKSMGYGPLVRASSGLTGLWRYPEIDGSYSDSITILPDHFAARIAATGVLAALIRRRTTGIGGKVVVSQSEAILNCFATQLLREGLQPGTLKPRGNSGEFDAPSNVYACAGDDVWAVIDVQGTAQFRALCQVIGREDLLGNPAYATAAGRIADREVLDAAVAAWCAERSQIDVRDLLQAAGVPAGNMQRLSEFDSDPHFLARGFFRKFTQPGFPSVLQTENGPVSRSELPEPVLNPAPLQGQHTRQLARELLGMDAAQIEALVAAGVFEPMQPNEFVSEA